jgi:catechol 2,3-dioxygenase-like lactoylglutathione lyase family enzyme
VQQRLLRFEGVVNYSTADVEEASHFFEHTLGLELEAQDGVLRFYSLGEGLTLTVDVSGASAGVPPYLLFSTPDLDAASEHFLGLGCQVRELPWATGAGFIASSPEGHAVAVVDETVLEPDEEP